VTDIVDWARNFDLFHPDFLADPFAIAAELRETCPVARSERFGGAWLPTRYEHVTAVARDPERFSSREASVLPRGKTSNALLGGLPPIESDPPEHTAARRLLLPWFAPNKVDRFEAYTRPLARRLLDGFADDGAADVAERYARQIPVRVIGLVLGIPEERADDFTTWTQDAIGAPPGDPRRDVAVRELVGYFSTLMAERRGGDGDDLISELLRSELDGAALDDRQVLAMIVLTLLAGIDTTWSSIGACLWHLAQHPADRQRLREEPDLWPTAIEELLRVYAPVTMARIAAEDTEVGGCPVHAGDRVLLPFSLANRDPAVFPDADTVVLDRELNRHVTFGAGIHRCAGSNLARMELRVALQEFLARIPDFSLADGAEVTWSGGQVRGPRSVPVVWPVG
jgi:cytochrome P450